MEPIDLYRVQSPAPGLHTPPNNPIESRAHQWLTDHAKFLTNMIQGEKEIIKKAQDSIAKLELEWARTNAAMDGLEDHR